MISKDSEYSHFRLYPLKILKMIEKSELVTCFFQFQASASINVSYNPFHYDPLSFQQNIYHITLPKFHCITHDGTLHYTAAHADQIFSLKIRTDIFACVRIFGMSSFG